MSENTSATPTKPVENSTTQVPAQGAPPFTKLLRAVDRLFDDYDPLTWRLFPARLRHIDHVLSDIVQTSPAADLIERDDAYELSVDLPGFEQKDIQVNLVQDCITVDAKKYEDRTVKSEDYHLSERRSGKLRRSFQLPPDINAEAIEASLSKGVLHIHLPKRPGSVNAQRTIEVKQT